MIDLDPSDIRGWFQLGVSHFRTERYEEALETFTKVIELKPDYAGAYDNRGNVYVKKADLMRAKGKTKEEKEFRKLANQDFLKAEALRETEGPE